MSDGTIDDYAGMVPVRLSTVGWAMVLTVMMDRVNQFPPGVEQNDLLELTSRIGIQVASQIP